MSAVFADLGISLDGFIAGPNAGPDNALGDGGARIHQWQYQVEAWRERQQRAGARSTVTMRSPRRSSPAPAPM
jgi:hypothetical protein